jgi:transposase
VPGNDTSAGKRHSRHPRKGSKRLSIARTEAAQANTRSHDPYLSAQYRGIKTRRGHKQAIGAVKHSIIVAAWHMLSTGETYHDAGGDYFTRPDPDKQTSASSPSSRASATPSRCRRPQLDPNVISHQAAE